MRTTKILLLITILASCGADDSKKPEPKPGVDPRPMLWEVDQLQTERNDCSEIEAETITQDSVWGFCDCLYQELTRIYTWEEYAANLIDVLKAQKPLIQECKNTRGEPIKLYEHMSRDNVLELLGPPTLESELHWEYSRDFEFCDSELLDCQVIFYTDDSGLRKVTGINPDLIHGELLE